MFREKHHFEPRVEAAEDKPYYFRPYRPSDVPFISNSWGTSYYSNGGQYTLLSPEEFHKHHRPKREAILQNPNAAIIICASKMDEDLILGYCVVERTESECSILHFIYVKHAFQNEKIGRELLKRSVLKTPVLFTHKTSRAEKIMKRHHLAGKELFEKYFYTPHLF